MMGLQASRGLNMSDDSGFLYLSDETLAGLGITTGEIVASIENAILTQAGGAVWTAPKAAILPGDGRYMMATLAAADEPAVVAVKSVIVSPGNPDRGLPAINGAIMLLDSETGVLRAVTGANWITAVRTAGLSVLAAKRLADPASQNIAFVGCGVQARSHLEAFCDLFPLREIRAFGRGTANVEALCEMAGAKGFQARACETAREVLTGADIMVSSITLNHDIEPFLDARWLKPGAYAAITDLAIPWMAETMAEFGTIVIDDLEQEAAMEKPMVAPDLVRGDLTGLVTGAAGAAFSPEKSTAFVFRGVAIGDFAVAGLALERAAAGGIGVRVA
jgi:ornithine cyclodeaminase